MTIRVKLGGDFDELSRRLNNGPSAIRKAIKVAVLREAQWMRTKMIQGLKSGAPAGKRLAPNSPWTVALKKSSKPLIHTAAMLNSIAVIKKGNGVFIGIKRSSKKGVNLALLHEKGAVIRQTVTPAQRRFFLAMSKKLFGQARAPKVGAALVIKIPARPFITPVVEKYHRTLANRIAKRFANQLLGGKYGRI